MKKATISISYDEEKLSALRLYLEQKDQTLETELIAAADTLYTKSVPANVRAFIDMKAGAVTSTSPSRKPKSVPSPAAGGAVSEVKEMNQKKISLYVNELRLKAVKDALAGDGFTIEDKLNEAFHFLYEQLVPYEQQTAIEAQIEKTEKAEQGIGDNEYFTLNPKGMETSQLDGSSQMGGMQL